MMNPAEKKTARKRRSLRTRSKTRQLDIHRLCIHRTPRHIYAQIITANGATVLASASTLDKQIKEQLNSSGTGNSAAAVAVGRIIAERAQQAGIKRVAFDRSGFRYHGRVKALAEAARENGLDF